MQPICHTKMKTIPNFRADIGMRAYARLTVLVMISLVCYGMIALWGYNQSDLSFGRNPAALLFPTNELARIESLGFFDDIGLPTWKRLQKRARTEQVYNIPSNPNLGSKDPSFWLLNNMDPFFTCPHEIRVGGRGDGPKWVCDPHRLVDKEDCLIYSIG
jgi:Methyltransferase domain